MANNDYVFLILKRVAASLRETDGNLKRNETNDQTDKIKVK